MWSVGITLFYLLLGKIPFTGRKLADLSVSIQNEQLEITELISDDIIDLLKKLTAKNPQERITLQEVRYHSWMTDDTVSK
jgi:[calcium/calmodulin-dependent protein kinase] kinase